MKVLWTQSGINRAGEPFVQLFADDDIICQFDPEEARTFARGLLEAAEGSENDSMLLEIMRKHGAPVQVQQNLLLGMREAREARGKKGPPRTAAEFVATDKHEKPDGSPSDVPL